MSNVLAFSCPHEPVSRKGFMQFVQDMYDKFNCTQIICLGDLIDWTAVSFHVHHPECPGPADEYKLAKSRVALWRDVFPEMTVTIGNHDERPGRKVEDAGVPSRFLRDYNEIWETPDWLWTGSTEVDDITYLHGTGYAGKYHSANIRNDMNRSVVAGHIHSVGMIHYAQSTRERIFGMNVGCGIDDKAFQFAYSRHNMKRSFLGCGVILDGVPVLLPMKCGRREPYHDSKFTKNGRRRKSYVRKTT